MAGLVARLREDGVGVLRMEQSGPFPFDVADVLAAVENDLPRPGVPFEALLPYDRGDLLNRIHTSGEVEHMEHTGDGTVVRGRVNADLAGDLAPYLLSPA